MLLRHAPVPFYQALLADLFGPPVITGIWWLMSKGLQANLGTSDDSVVADWTRSLGKFILTALYLIGFGLTIYTYWINPYKGSPGR
jgi:hypothetical protein